MKKKFIFLLVSLLHVFCLTGCQKVESEINNTNQGQEPLEERTETVENVNDYEEIISQEYHSNEIESQEYIDLEEEDTSSEDIELLKKINENKIEEQSFKISLNDWGEVSFVSCMPDFDENSDPLTDVSFYLINDEKILYHFPDVAINNISTSGLCEGISFVFFDDINRDNKKDIIIGVMYILGAGPQGMVPYTRIRIYEDYGNEFVYNKSLCDEINTNLPSEVTAEYIKTLLIK